MNALPKERGFAARLAEARNIAARSGGRVVETLEEQLGLPPEVYLELLGRELRQPTLPMARLHELAPAFDAIPFPEAVKRNCLAFRDESGGLLLAAGDPFDAALWNWAEAAISEPFAWRLAHYKDVSAYLSRHEDELRAMDEVLAQSDKADERTAGGEDLSIRSISEDSSPVVKLVHSTLYDGLKAGASDLHLETDDVGLRVKYRIDGVLASIAEFPGGEFAEQVISRIKVMSELDIAERRIPQDGRFKAAVQGRDVDFRVSVMPSVFGEDAVIRILDRRNATDKVKGLKLDDLGFAPDAVRKLRKLATAPYGMVLVTGPTGSGKTTTLYAAISEVNHGRDKIVTIEDPVEYQLPGVLQIPVNEKKGLTFARGLRSILRHDPDKIMVGEIRDPETAQIAVQSALTGHLVFTTVHANNVFDVLGRFTHMGVDPYSFVSALNGILAQRLVRLSCPACAEPYAPDAAELEESGIGPDEAKDYVFKRGNGCGHCRGSGYKGRVAVAEMLHLNDEIRELIVSREPVRRIREAARRNGTRTLREAALDLAKAGRTTLEEINRVTFVA
jgi:general secretion pathway protein E